MKNVFASTTILAMVIMASSSMCLRAQIQDITVNNGQGTSPSDYEAISTSDQYAYLATDFNTNPDPRVVNGVPVMALGYVNANCVPDKSWDLEAFGYNSTASALTYVGGFNPLTANEGYSLGDIFLSAGTVTQPNGLSQNMDYSNPGYTYAIHFTPPTSGTTLGYTIYKLAANTQLQTVAFNQNLVSDPYALDLNNLGSATVFASGTTSVRLFTGAQVNGLLSENLFTTTADQASADNYVMSLNLSALGLSSFDVSLTEQCGNDDLKGYYSGFVAAPEPKSIYYALAVIFALWGTRYSLRRKSVA